MVCMKKPFLFAPMTIIGISLASLQFLTVNLRAADPIPPVPPGSSLPPPQAPASPTPPAASSGQPLSPGFGAQAGGKHNGRFKKLKNELGLTPDQIAKIKPIIQSAHQQKEALRSNTSLPQNERRQQIKQIETSSFQQIRPILTPEQLQKWKQIREARRNNSQKI